MNIATFTHMLEFDKDIAADKWKNDITWQITIDWLKVNEKLEMPFNSNNPWWREFFEFIDDNGFNVEYILVRDSVYKVIIEPKNLQK